MLVLLYQFGIYRDRCLQKYLSIKSVLMQHQIYNTVILQYSNFTMMARSTLATEFEDVWTLTSEDIVMISRAIETENTLKIKIQKNLYLTALFVDNVRRVFGK